jgi:hypothetical protein
MPWDPLSSRRGKRILAPHSLAFSGNAVPIGASEIAAVRRLPGSVLLPYEPGFRSLNPGTPGARPVPTHGPAKSAPRP